MILETKIESNAFTAIDHRRWCRRRGWWIFKVFALLLTSLVPSSASLPPFCALYNRPFLFISPSSFDSSFDRLLPYVANASVGRSVDGCEQIQNRKIQYKMQRVKCLTCVNCRPLRAVHFIAGCKQLKTKSIKAIRGCNRACTDAHQTIKDAFVIQFSELSQTHRSHRRAFKCHWKMSAFQFHHSGESAGTNNFINKKKKITKTNTLIAFKRWLNGLWYFATRQLSQNKAKSFEKFASSFFSSFYNVHSNTNEKLN